MTTPYLCDCGCGSEISDAAFAAGRRFKRGHKPVLENKIKTKFQPRIPRAKPGTSINVEDVIKFHEAQLRLLDEEIAQSNKLVERFEHAMELAQEKYYEVRESNKDMKTRFSTLQMVVSILKFKRDGGADQWPE